jgi:hypothetical protein
VQVQVQAAAELRKSLKRMRRKRMKLQAVIRGELPG